MPAGSLPPADIETFRATVEARYAELSDRLQRVARHLLDEPHDVAFETLAVIAARSNVQASTIVRFAQAFGFQGASQMQRLLRDGLLRDTQSVGYAERVRQFRYAVPAESDSPRQLLSEFVEGNMLALENLSHAIAPQQLETAVEMIERAETVFVMGFRRSFPVATYLAYLLAQADKRIVLVDGIAGMQGQQMRSMNDGDLVIAISFTPYSAETTQIVEAAAGAGGAVIVISDSVISPVARQASLVFHVRESEVRGFRSLSASMCLAQSLAIGFALRAARAPDSSEAPDPLSDAS